MKSREYESLSQNNVFIFFFRFYAFYIFINNFMIFIKIDDFLSNIGPIRAHMGPYGLLWALMGPPGQVLEDSVDSKLSVNFP